MEADPNNPRIISDWEDDGVDATAEVTYLGPPSKSYSFGSSTSLINNVLMMGGTAAAVGYFVSHDAAASALLSHPPHSISTAVELAKRFPADLWQQYSQAVNAHPVVTKACTSGFVYALGDIISQRTERGISDTAVGASLDYARTLRSATAGFVGHGPLSHCWYNVCDGLFNDVLQWTAWWVVPAKILVDQTIWGPIWNNLYIMMLGVMKQERPSMIWSDMKRSTIPLVVSGLKLWPAAHVITYGFLPNENRLLWVDLVEIAWVTILSTQAASLTQAAEAKEDGAALLEAEAALASVTTRT